MNIQQLFEISSFLRAEESRLRIQPYLNSFHESLSQLAGQPQHQPAQMNAAQALTNYEQALTAFQQLVTPGQEKLLSEIGALEFFSATRVNEFRTAMAANAMTPIVVANEVQEFASRRQTYLSHLEATQRGLEALKVGLPEPNVQHSAELAFLLPRPLFDNHLGDLAKELRVINNIISFFSEVVTGAPQQVEVHQISTSDPTFFLGIDLETIKAIAGTVGVLMTVFTKAKKIRDAREEAKSVGLSADQLKAFDDIIKWEVETAVDRRTKELLENYKGPEARRNELEISLRWAADSLSARIDRGMKVEVKLLEPPQPQGATESDPEALASKPTILTELRVLSKELQFSVITGDPILAIPAPEPPPTSNEAASKPELPVSGHPSGHNPDM